MATGPGGGAGQAGPEDGFIVAALVIVAVVVMTMAVYSAHKNGINSVFLYFARAELWPFGFFSARAHALAQEIASLQPRQLTYEDITKVMFAAGQYGRWILSPLIFFSAWRLWQHIGWIEQFTRQFTMESLAKHNAKAIPVLLPVVNRKRSLLEENPMEGPWRVHDSPMLFALRHGIVVDGNQQRIPIEWLFDDTGLPKKYPKIPESGLIYDRRRALVVYRSRMGPPHPGFDEKFNLNPGPPKYIIGLIGAFCAFGLGDRKAGQAILDEMALSWDEEVALTFLDPETEVCGDFPIEIGDAKSWIRRAMTPPKDRDGSARANLARGLQLGLTGKHDRYLWVWMAALLIMIRKNSGTSPPLEFIWLRPAARPLWYLLNPIGGTGAMTEGAAPWSHLLSAIVYKQEINTPDVSGAVNALRVAIEDEGWMRYAAAQKPSGAHADTDDEEF